MFQMVSEPFMSTSIASSAKIQQTSWVKSSTCPFRTVKTQRLLFGFFLKGPLNIIASQAGPPEGVVNSAASVRGNGATRECHAQSTHLKGFQPN